MARGFSLKKISFNTTKIEEAFLVSLNEHTYHASTKTEFMHKLLTDFMNRSKTGGSFPPIISDAPDSSDDASFDNATRESLEMKLIMLCGTGSMEEFLKTRKQLRDLERREEAANAKLKTPVVDDPNAIYRETAEQSRLLAELAENCARFRRACSLPGYLNQSRMTTELYNQPKEACRSQSRT